MKLQPGFISLPGFLTPLAKSTTPHSRHVYYHISTILVSLAYPVYCLQRHLNKSLANAPSQFVIAQSRVNDSRVVSTVMFSEFTTGCSPIPTQA